MKKEEKKMFFELAAKGGGNLSADTLKNLSEFKKLSEAIPVIDKPYTQLLADINDKKRIFKQSTFGDIEDFDPEMNVCGSAMCTAGHLVNMAGKAGYDLKKAYGWETEASVIHYKAHPNIPPQNFGSIPQEWALGYIEYMAEIESNQKLQPPYNRTGGSN